MVDEKKTSRKNTRLNFEKIWFFLSKCLIIRPVFSSDKSDISEKIEYDPMLFFLPILIIEWMHRGRATSN